jgi:hypothetical protein
MDGLPDPEHDAQYYEGVPARRLAAWVIDLFVILLAGVPIALVFGIATFGIGFALFPFVVATVGFLYRVATISRLRPVDRNDLGAQLDLARGDLVARRRGAVALPSLRGGGCHVCSWDLVEMRTRGASLQPPLW